jgi:NADPH-dependent 7-cyano-7-deazaguanine reductase QueF
MLDNLLKQIYMANGGDWGGVKVDQAFDKFCLILLAWKQWIDSEMKIRQTI